MRRHKRDSLVRSLALEIVVSGVVLYIIGGIFYQSVEMERLGQRSGTTVTLSTTGLQVRVGWGWPSEYWIRSKITAEDYGNHLEVGHECFGFLLGYRRTTYYARPRSVRWIVLGLPWWFLVALAFGRRLERLEHRRRIRAGARCRARRGTCRNCGYDLRASPDRCPECGERVPPMWSTHVRAG